MATTMHATDAWTDIQRLADQMPGADAERVLAELFAAGDVADVDGQTEGLLVGFMSEVPGLDRTGRVVYEVAKAASRIAMPWLGKQFDQSAQRGTNSVTQLAVVLALPIAPRYRFRKAGDHYEGFDMLNRVEESVIAPGTDVLVLDYEAPELRNPAPINRIRDEAVQLAPGVYLGAKLWHQGDTYKQLAWWAARS